MTFFRVGFVIQFYKRRRKMLERKQTRLKEYDYSKNGEYFITICIEQKRKILGTILSVGDDDHIVPKMELSQYGLIVEKYIK